MRSTTPTRRRPRRAPTEADPLAQILRSAASKTDDEATRRWLTDLLERGEYAHGTVPATQTRNGTTS